MSKILVTGGAGFIGSHLVDALIKAGYEVRGFDNLIQQVHGPAQEIPGYFNQRAEFIKGDVRDKKALREALKDVGVIFHLAAAVGVAQSMYEVCNYIEINTLGTANLLDILVNEKHRVKKLIVAGSMSEYGEGGYECSNCGIVYPELRNLTQLQKREWEMKCPRCGKVVKPIPTPEDKPLFPASIYAISKRDQEEMSLCVGRTYGIPVVILRYFNTYGSRQALSNPYTGVAAIFSSRILNGHSPVIFEDGLQGRDFIHVNDIVEANLLAMKSEKANYEVFNVGTSRLTTVDDIAHLLISKLNSNVKPIIANKFREGDIRHCFADISKIQKVLDFQPKIKFEDGIEELVSWVKDQQAKDFFEKANQELREKGLTI